MYLVWSMNDAVKPVSPTSAVIHTHKGSQVINLLGKLELGQEREGAQSFTLQTTVCIATTVMDIIP